MRIFCLLCLLAMAIQANAQTYTDRKTAPPKAVKALDKALSLSRGGQSDKALASVNKAITASPTFIDAWLLKANLFLDQKNWVEAEKALEKSAQLNAEFHPNTYRWLAETEWEQDKFAECAMHARQFLSSPSANRYLGVNVFFIFSTIGNTSAFRALWLSPLADRRKRTTPKLGRYANLMCGGRASSIASIF